MDIIHPGKDIALEEFPLFADLSARELALVKERVVLVEYAKGAIVYEEGAPPSAFYGLVSGRMEISTSNSRKEKTVLEYLHRGTYFGIISLLTDESHSVTATAINECVVLQISHKDFAEVLKAIPRLAIDVSRTLSRRLKRKDVHQKTIFESTVLAVFSSYPHAGKTVYALNLSLSLARETRKSVIIVDIAHDGATAVLAKRLKADDAPVVDLSESLHDTIDSVRAGVTQSPFGVQVMRLGYTAGCQVCVKRLAGILGLLVNDYHYIVLDVPAVLDDVSLRILHQADQVHVLTSPEPVDLRRTRTLADRLRDEYKCDPEKVRVVINENRTTPLSLPEQMTALQWGIFATLPYIDSLTSDRIVLDQPDAPYSKQIRMIARTVGERLVGLVLGVGVAYGLCHVGVLKVIEEENIPVDVIAGSSIGALMASLWAVGYSSKQILRIVNEFKKPGSIWGLIDLTFPHIGFIRGKRLRKFLQRHFGEKTFADTRLSLRIIATDVKRKALRVFDEGPLVDAIMASCAMPGVFAPFRIKEDMLFDGGVGHPLPTEPLLTMGVKKIIAVNVTPSRDDLVRQYERMRSELVHPVAGRAAQKEKMGFIRYMKTVFQNNILDIIFSSVEMLQSEVAQKEAQFADVVLHPDTSGLYWTELHRAQEFLSRGEIEARKHLDAIRRLVNE